MDEELKGLLSTIGGKLDAMDRKIDAMDRKVDAMSHDITTLKQDVADLKTSHAVLTARLDEQRLTLTQIGGTVNALIPTRLAAVPPAAAE